MLDRILVDFMYHVRVIRYSFYIHFIVVQSGNDWTALMLPGGGKDLATAASISTLKEEPKDGKVKTEETIGDFYLFFLNY